MPVIATTACADFRSAPGRFAGCAYRPGLLPGATGWRARGRSRPVRRRTSPVPHSAVQTFRSPCAGGLLRAVLPSSSPRAWPSPLSQRLGSPLFPWDSRIYLRRCRIHLTLRTACLLDPRRAFVVALRRRGSLLAPATRYTAAWSLPWPDSHRRVECSLQDAREREDFMCRMAPAVPAAPVMQISPRARPPARRSAVYIKASAVSASLPARGRNLRQTFAPSSAIVSPEHGQAGIAAARRAAGQGEGRGSGGSVSGQAVSPCRCVQVASHSAFPSPPSLFPAPRLDGRKHRLLVQPSCVFLLPKT